MITEMIGDNAVYRNMGICDIQKFQKNRYPLLLIDFVKEVVPGKSAVGHKNFTYNEWFFPVHFKDNPYVPEFVQMEALEEMFLMTFLTLPENVGVTTACINVKTCFGKKIIPGDRLDITAELNSYKRGIAKGKSIGLVNGEIACSADLMLGIPSVMKKYRPMGK